MAPPGSGLYDQAVAHHKAKRFVQAAEVYRAHLAEAPDDATALAALAAATALCADGSSAKHDEALQLARRAVQLRPSCARLRHTLGWLYERALPPRWGEAADAYERACEKDRGNVQMLLDLGRALKELDRPARAAEAYARAAFLQPSHPRVHFRLAMALRRAGHGARAAEHFRRHLELDPGHAASRFWLAALSGDAAAAAACPPDMVAGLFDQYADTFDSHLVGVLQYRTPGLLRDLLFRAADELRPGGCAPRWRTAVDLGCGTGLMGPLLRAECRWLAGVDLSAGMCEKARERGCYDEVEVGELVEWLRRRQGRRREGARQQRQQPEGRPEASGVSGSCRDDGGSSPSSSSSSTPPDSAHHGGGAPRGSGGCEGSSDGRDGDGAPFGLLVAADVLVYMGDLAPLLAAAADAAEPGALFALSTELLPDPQGSTDCDTSTTGVGAGSSSVGILGYTLQPTGRYAHSPSYIRNVASKAGWHVAALEAAVIRSNLGKPIHGSLCVLERL